MSGGEQGRRRRGMAVRIIAASALATLAAWVWIKVQAYHDFRRDLTSYRGIRLGDTMEEIEYALGYPPFVLDAPAYDAEMGGYSMRVYQTDNKDPQNLMPASMKVQDFLGWQYQQDSHRIDVTFDATKKQVSGIGCYANGPAQQCPSIFGIDSNSSEDDVLASLGKADAYKYEGPSKSYRYDAIGLEVSMEKRRVYMVEKTPPQGSGARWFFSHRLLSLP
ncbi:hypothetical protein NXC12_CH00537 [Rhizobium etli]|uniref:Uncharacterized protein n=1 Tax=Rhizobium etli TaxID=29449 RepID=A0AAN1BCE5_RHIET|nr:hypothetical protein [Rhizobium etli]ARQ08628.1 hypothetical protein NXC12_CH00537 [Rhizobium etli]